MKENILERARARLVIVSPFFGSILLRHPMRATDEVPTAAVNLRGEIMYNPNFTASLTMGQAVFLLAHETMHVALAHLARRGDRDMRVWNIANDAIINEIIRKEMKSDAEFIDGGVEIPEASEYSSEQLYEKLMRDARENPNKIPQLAVDDLCHEKSEPLTSAEAKQLIADAKAEMAAAAASSKMCGSLSGNIEQVVKDFLDSKVPWYQVLERFFTGRANQHQSWSHPNKRFRRVAYLPRRERMPSMGHVVIGVDTSGSIEYADLQKYFGHLNALFEQCHPSGVTVVYCDCHVRKTEEFLPDEFPVVAREIDGGGGTDMRAVVDWAQENTDADALVIFTDGYTPLPEACEVHMPLVWVCSTDALSKRDVVGEVITDYKE